VGFEEGKMKEVSHFLVIENVFVYIRSNGAFDNIRQLFEVNSVEADVFFDANHIVAVKMKDAINFGEKRIGFKRI